ncbi:MAG: permease [Spirulinaceae cyanobacterium SM2_1_0]|nr:permease [Spirulinaceae cyanobacterium SM2_1_0]
MTAVTVAQARPSERADFIRKTYLHLAGAVAAFLVLEILLVPLLGPVMINIASSGIGWMLVLGAFVLLGWMARSLARSTSSLQLQYLGLGLYVLFEAIIFIPLIFIAVAYSDPTVLPTAAVLTGLMFAGLTAIAFITRKDFSFLSGILTLGGFLALGLIICSFIFGFSLGLLFSVFMVALASGAILYDTSNIIHHYRPGQHVAASLELFASVALLFWYILRIVMALSRD